MELLFAIVFVFIAILIAFTLVGALNGDWEDDMLVGVWDYRLNTFGKIVILPITLSFGLGILIRMLLVKVFVKNE